MRKLLIPIVCVGLLTACASTEPAPVVTKTVEVPAQPAQPVVNEMDEMVDMIRTADPFFNGVSDSEIIDTANIFCETLRGGATLADIGAVAQETIGVDAAAALGAGAIIYICPDQKYKIG